MVLGHLAYGPPCVWAGRPIASHCEIVEKSSMRDDRILRIDECLTEESFDAWAREVVVQVEEYLAKHAAFESFLNGED